jgi:hypothetical protein
MDLIDVMRKLYDSKINCGLQTFYDGETEVWLGDDRNGIHAMEWFDIEDLEQAAQWLDKAAREHYPDSTYAKTSR